MQHQKSLDLFSVIQLLQLLSSQGSTHLDTILYYLCWKHSPYFAPTLVYYLFNK